MLKTANEGGFGERDTDRIMRYLPISDTTPMFEDLDFIRRTNPEHPTVAHPTDDQR